MGCCKSKPAKRLKPLNPNSNLAKALELTQYKGNDIPKPRRPPPQSFFVNELKQTNLPEEHRKIYSEPFNKFEKLLNFLYLTGIGGLSRENLAKYDITLIINATFESPLLEDETITSYRVPVDDEPTEDISIYFDEVSDKILECKQIGGKCVIHCLAGASRSTTLVLAYLIKHENMSLKNAFRSVRKRRNISRPNYGFWDQLTKYELKVRAKTTVKVMGHREQGVDIKYPDIYRDKEHRDLLEHEVQSQIGKYHAKGK